MLLKDFAKDELKDYTIYRELAKIERDRDLRKLLNKLASHELQHYKFFVSQIKKEKIEVNKFDVFFFKILRKIFGLTFTLKFLERHEKEVIREYKEYAKKAKDSLRLKWRKVINDEEFHENSIIEQIKEERVKYTGSIILGLNDGLVELTGALAGLTAALQNNLLVAISGLIAGVAASLSMAASSYLQAKQENRNPKKSGIYTGLSYIFVVFLLVFPFFIIQNVFFSLILTITIACLLVTFTSYYLSVLFNRNFRKELLEMFVFSLGTAVVVFLIGYLANTLINIQY